MVLLHGLHGREGYNVSCTVVTTWKVNGCIIIEVGHLVFRTTLPWRQGYVAVELLEDM